MFADTHVTYLRRAAAALRTQARRPSYRTKEAMEMIGRASVLDTAVQALLASPNRRAIRVSGWKDSKAKRKVGA